MPLPPDEQSAYMRARRKRRRLAGVIPGVGLWDLFKTQEEIPLYARDPDFQPLAPEL